MLEEGSGVTRALQETMMVLLTKVVTLIERRQLFSQVDEKYTNADSKIFQYLRLHMKIICRRFHMKTIFTF